MTSRPARICSCSKKARSWSEFRINLCQYGMTYFQRWDLINFESILFSCSLIVCLSKVPSLLLHMKSLARCLGSCYFFLFQRKLYILFSIPFLIFWNSINLAYVSQLVDKDLVSDYLFTSQRVSLCSRYGFFLLYLHLFCPILSHLFCHLFLYAPPHKGLAFWKKYLWASLFLHFHIFLKSLVSY